MRLLKPFFAFFLFFVALLASCHLYAQTAEAIQSQPTFSWKEFFISNWSSIGLVLSEMLSFLPSKFSGIIRTAWSVAGSIFFKSKNS